MGNEMVFFVFFVLLMGINLLAFRFGKLYLFVLVALYTLLMNIFVVKQFSLFGFATAGGNALYGGVFFLTDLLSEHYGKEAATTAVRIGFVSMCFFVVATQVLLLFEPNSYDFAQDALHTLFSVSPRILFGSLLAYGICQHLDIALYHRVKDWTGGKYLFLRNNVSTMISQLVDTVVFTAVGLTSFSFAPGVIDVEIFWEVVLVAYVMKLAVAALDTPFLYLSSVIGAKER